MSRRPPLFTQELRDSGHCARNGRRSNDPQLVAFCKRFVGYLEWAGLDIDDEIVRSLPGWLRYLVAVPGGMTPPRVDELLSRILQAHAVRPTGQTTARVQPMTIIGPIVEMTVQLNLATDAASSQ